MRGDLQELVHIPINTVPSRALTHHRRASPGALRSPHAGTAFRQHDRVGEVADMGGRTLQLVLGERFEHFSAADLQPTLKSSWIREYIASDSIALSQCIDAR
jgi:tRNA A22 N-methylase